MQAVGIICEYNPFHNGHVYHIQKTKELFPNSILILVLNGYFLERGEISILSKSAKTNLALQYGIDIVVELPSVFGTQAADIFAEKALEILNHFEVSDVVFGSECNDISKLTFLAEKQSETKFTTKLQTLLKEGVNYPSALSKALNVTEVIPPNDLLGISYAKAIIKNQFDIKLHTIERNNDYHDISSNDVIISATNIRNKIEHGEDISSFVPKDTTTMIQTIHYDKVWQLLRFRILTDPDLSIYMTVDEGIEWRLKKCARISSSLFEFMEMIKTKRYTYNKIRRMIIHILLGFTKHMNQHLVIDYIHVLGFNHHGQDYLKQLKTSLPLRNFKSQIYQIEEIAAYLYDEFTNSSETIFEKKHCPIQKY